MTGVIEVTGDIGVTGVTRVMGVMGRIAPCITAAVGSRSSGMVDMVTLWTLPPGPTAMLCRLPTGTMATGCLSATGSNGVVMESWFLELKSMDGKVHQFNTRG